ncbi:MAG: RrF2 family transcriptional regulator [Rhizobiaceae bacterium]
MRLNQASDFALRIMMLLCREKKPLTVDAISQRLKLVKSHVMKIVAKLVKAGVLTSRRGRSGGVSLARDGATISVGEVVRVIEADFAIVECMLDRESTCVFAGGCKLQGVMGNARKAFLGVLDKESLKSIADGVSLDLSSGVA